MTALSEDVKTFIVTELAMWRPPTEIAESVKAIFGIEVSRQRVHAYDPDGSGGPAVATRWKELHAVTRKYFLSETAEIPIANRAYRLREYQDLFQRAKKRGADALAAEFLEKAAKEAGGAYTNRRELTGHNGGPIATEEVSVYTPEERKARIAELLAIAAGDDEPEP